jgi:hypothetical protein
MEEVMPVHTASVVGILAVDKRWTLPAVRGSLITTRHRVDVVHCER